MGDGKRFALPLGMDRKDHVIAELMAEVERLRGELQTLRQEVARLRKNSRNSSKPPSSDIVKPTSSSPATGRRRKKRSHGGQPGHAKHPRKPFPPEDVDQIVEVQLPAEQTRGLRPLRRWRVVQQVELVENPFVITEYRARRYRDRRTGQIVKAPLPPEVVAAGLVGPRLSAAIAFQKAACHMSYSTIRTFWQDLTGLSICRGQLVKVVQKVSRAIRQPYVELREALPHEDRVGIDESGHKDGGKRLWTWCFRAGRFTVFHIAASRGSEVLRAVLGETFGGVIQLRLLLGLSEIHGR